MTANHYFLTQAYTDQLIDLLVILYDVFGPCELFTQVCNQAYKDRSK